MGRPIAGLYFVSTEPSNQYTTLPAEASVNAEDMTLTYDGNKYKTPEMCHPRSGKFYCLSQRQFWQALGECNPVRVVWSRINSGFAFIYLEKPYRQRTIIRMALDESV